MAIRVPSHAAVTHVRVELFGVPRILAGRKHVELALEAQADRAALCRGLALTCPALVGKVIRADGSDIEDGYIFNLNGTAFLPAEVPRLSEGDNLLLLSSQAGG